MKRATFVGIIFAAALCGLVSWASAEPARADVIPALKTIPENLPAYVKKSLSKQRKKVDKDYEDFKKAGDEFSGRPRAQQSDTEYAAHLAWRTRHIRDAKAFNREVEAALKKQEALKKQLTLVVTWKGNWGEGQKEKVVRALTEFEDEKLRNWIAKLTFDLLDDPGLQGLPSPWMKDANTLAFNDYFSSCKDDRQENLIAFEAGKAFLTRNSEILMNWFSENIKLSLISELKNAHQENKEDLSWVYDDPQESYSGFGYVFRAQALGLKSKTPEGQKAQREFKKRIDPLLRANQ